MTEPSIISYHNETPLNDRLTQRAKLKEINKKDFASIDDNKIREKLPAGAILNSPLKKKKNQLTCLANKTATRSRNTI